MAPLIDLVAGDRREILLAAALEDWDGLADTGRFPAHLTLDGALDLDLEWLDWLSWAIRDVTGSSEPADFLAARLGLVGAQATERQLERMDPSWIAAVAALESSQIPGVADRWIARIAAERGEPAAESASRIRELTAQIVEFAQVAIEERDVLLAWSL